MCSARLWCVPVPCQGTLFWLQLLKPVVCAYPLCELGRQPAEWSQRTKAFVHGARMQTCITIEQQNGHVLSACAGQGRYGSFLSDISQFYMDFHHKCYGKWHVHVHDPAALVATIRKDLFKWEQGPAIVGTEGPLRGKTLVDCAALTCAHKHATCHKHAKGHTRIAWRMHAHLQQETLCC
jgi:hypothetical protein